MHTLYVCMYVCIYIYIYMYVCMYVYIYIYVCMCVYIYIYMIKRIRLAASRRRQEERGHRKSGRNSP